jgi:hypothetical protein
MDLTMRKRLVTIWCALVIIIGTFFLPIISPAELNRFENFSFDDCDPFQARARIMDVDGKTAQLVAAEQKIHVVDWQLGDRQMVTELTDADGDPIDFGSLRRGQWIFVKGFRHIDGGVVASLVQRIEPPAPQKPVIRKISKEGRRHKHLRRHRKARDN